MANLNLSAIQQAKRRVGFDYIGKLIRCGFAAVLSRKRTKDQKDRFLSALSYHRGQNSCSFWQSSAFYGDSRYEHTC